MKKQNLNQIQYLKKKQSKNPLRNANHIFNPKKTHCLFPCVFSNPHRLKKSVIRITTASQALDMGGERMELDEIQR